MESVRTLSLIPAGALVDLLQRLPTKPGHVRIQFISPNISDLRHVRCIFQFNLLNFFFLPQFENYRFTCFFF